MGIESRIAAGALAALLAWGCTDGSASGKPKDTSVADTDTDTDTDADTDSDTDSDTDADTDTDTSECADAADCDALYGAPVCGTWACTVVGTCELDCPGCTDADGDGYGPEATCAGLDCDDSDPAVTGTVAIAACYTGPPGTAGVAACSEGIQACEVGIWTQCVGEVVPNGEACNDLDDDCDGYVDEDMGDLSCGVGACEDSVPACLPGGVSGDCAMAAPIGPDNTCDGVDDDCDGWADEDCPTGCVWVTPTGDDLIADGTDLLPWGTIQGAIDSALPGSFVCVAAGVDCNDTFDYAEDLSMADGIHVYGGYETAGQSRCGVWNTRILPTAPEGVLFGNTVQTPTILAGFEIVRADLATTAGVTADGAVGATVVDVHVAASTGLYTQDSYGINAVFGADVTVKDSWIVGGDATLSSVGIRAVGSTVHLTANCETRDGDDACLDVCPSPLNGNSRGILGRDTPGPVGSESWAVLLDGAPGSTVTGNAICGTEGDHGAAIRIRGDAAGIAVRGNHLEGQGEVDGAGVWLSECVDTAPWIVDNLQIVGMAATPFGTVAGVRSEGACHPVIEGNGFVHAIAQGSVLPTSGIWCGADPSGISKCGLFGNIVTGSSLGSPPESAGVRCTDGGCNALRANLVSGGDALDTWGLSLDEAGPLVSGNRIEGGCGTVSAGGIRADNAYGRLENNAILAGSCGQSPDSWGMKVTVADGIHLLDVHSNFIDGQNAPGTCDSTGVELVADPQNTPTLPEGIWRNNIIAGGDCSDQRHVFSESAVSVDPEIFENNNLSSEDNPDALYVDADTVALTTEGEVNALADITVGGNISDDPDVVSYPTDLHLNGGSPCIDAGTASGAPLVDSDGDVRDLATPDIGPDERP